MRHLFLWGPQVQVVVGDPRPAELPGFYDVTVTASVGSATQQETFLVSPDGKKLVRGTVYDLAKSPFAEDLARLHTGEAPTLGSADAPLKLVVFSDFQCGYCRRNAKVLHDERLPAFGADLQIVYKDYPLDPIHPWAKTAAIAGRCVYKQKPEAFWTLHEWIFGHQDQINGGERQGARCRFRQGAWARRGTLQACLDARPRRRKSSSRMAEARTLGVNSTPTMYLNGRNSWARSRGRRLKEILTQELAFTRRGTSAKAAPGRAQVRLRRSRHSRSWLPRSRSDVSGVEAHAREEYRCDCSTSPTCATSLRTN